jgi:GntR family transcriptional regulator
VTGEAAVFVPDRLTLDRRLPLWYQVAQSLRASVLGRPPEAPDRLPTEQRLAAHYGVSVLTVRQALADLAAEGLISRHRRRGTFVAPGAPRGTPVRLLGSVDAVVAQQSGGTATLLAYGPARPPAEFAALFPADADLVAYRRLRRDEAGEPADWAENHVPADLAARIDPADLTRRPMTRVLRDVLGVPVARITNTLEARPADAEDARLLGVAAGSPILHCVGVVRDGTGRVVDAVRIRHRGDRFAYTVAMDTF